MFRRGGGGVGFYTPLSDSECFDLVLHRCRKFLNRTLLQYATTTSRAGQLKILSFYAFIGPLHIFALLSCGNKEN